MNPKQYIISSLRRAGIALILLAGIFPVPAKGAQPAAQNPPGRYLFIFDTSSDMKRYVPAVQRELDNLFMTSLSGQLQRGDSIGIWTFDRQLRTGQFPLQFWVPEKAVTMASNITQFVGRQRYSRSTTFQVLQPSLNAVIRDSKRLTVVIFCDARGKIVGTPYDSGINRVFLKRQNERKKARQPIIVLLRTQLGHYVGCTVNYPPGQLAFPRFPPLPPPLEASPPTNALTKPRTNHSPQATGPSLIIIGTNVISSLSSANPAPTNSLSLIVTGAPPVAAANTVAAPHTHTNMPQSPSLPALRSSVPSSNRTSAVPVLSEEAVTRTNTVSLQRKAPVAGTNLVAPQNSGIGRKKSLVIGSAFVIAAATVLTALSIFRARRTGRGNIVKKD